MPGVLAEIPSWQSPSASDVRFDYADLRTLDLSTVTGDDYEHVPDSVVKATSDVFSRDGFIYATNFGLSDSEVRRQFSLAQFAFNGIPHDEKARCPTKVETGDYTGYKLPGALTIKGAPDYIEQLNLRGHAFLPENHDRYFPPALQPFIAEIEAFRKYNHDHIFRKVLSVLSRILELPATYLWKLANKDSGMFRYALYHPPTREDELKTGGVRLQGHTDFRAVTLLYSQPIVALQVLMPDNVWRYVRHVPNALVINLGDTMRFISGGFLKPTIHRVISPPDPAQAQFQRIGVFYFAALNEDVRLVPVADSPIASSTGQTFFNNGKDAPTAWEWETTRVKTYGLEGKKKTLDDGHEEEVIIGGEKAIHYN